MKRTRARKGKRAAGGGEARNKAADAKCQGKGFASHTLP
jgi:hypothetical protein